MQILFQIKFTQYIRLTILYSSMLRKNFINTSNTFYTGLKKQPQQNNLLGEPYTEFPVPVERQSTNSNSLSPKEYNKHSVLNANYQHKRNMQSADSKFRNPGLMNIGRKINLNTYNKQSAVGQAEAIRRLGMEYSRKLQHRYNKSNYNAYNTRISTCKKQINLEKQMKDWYQERSQSLQKLYLQYMKKIQVELTNNPGTKEQRQQFMNQINKAWQLETPGKLKKCFEL